MLTGAGVPLTGAAVVPAAETAGVVIGDEDELVHPVTRTIPMTKTAIAHAIPRFRFRLGTFFDSGEIELIRVLLWFKIIRIYAIYRSVGSLIP